MAGVTGLEPAASGVTGRRSNQLSYTPKPRRMYCRAPLMSSRRGMIPHDQEERTLRIAAAA